LDFSIIQLSLSITKCQILISRFAPFAPLYAGAARVPAHLGAAAQRHLAAAAAALAAAATALAAAAAAAASAAAASASAAVPRARFRRGRVSPTGDLG
jgi:hypothetical protein